MSVRMKASGNGLQWGASCIALASVSKSIVHVLCSSASGLPSVSSSAEICTGALCELPGTRLAQQGRNAISEC